MCALFRRMAGAFWRVEVSFCVPRCPRSRVSGGGGNLEQGKKGVGRATHPKKNREMTEKACQVKGDTSLRRVMSPKRSEKAPQNSGKGEQRGKYQNTYRRRHTRTHYKPRISTHHHQGEEEQDLLPLLLLPLVVVGVLVVGVGAHG